MRERLRAIREQSEGQVIVFVAICMVVLIGMTGFALDVGHAYFVQRELQRSADAAALAAAQELPDGSAAIATAHAYSGEDGAKNETTTVKTTTSTITPKCLKLGNLAPFGCKVGDGTYNTVQVRQDARVPTSFARVLGIDALNVHATATACSPCEAGPPLDIMVVLDRTSSMCDGPSGNKCRDLNFARDGIKTFLQLLDPALDHVGLAVLPPAPANPTATQKCSPPPGKAAYDNANAEYIVEPLSGNYLNPDGSLNQSTGLGYTLYCLQPGDYTGYADAIDAAQKTLATTGRATARDVIVLLSDGAANYGGLWHGINSPYRTTPCAQGVISAGVAKAQGTSIFSIGYDIDNPGNVACKTSTGTNIDESPAMSSFNALSGISSDPSTMFYNQPDPGSLRGIFTQLAADVSGLASRLIEDDAS